MQVFIKGTDGKTSTLDVKSGDKIDSIKKKYYEKTKTYRPEQQRLIFAGEELINEKTLDESDIKKESTLHLLYKRNLFEEKTPTKPFFGDMSQFIQNVTSMDNDEEKIIVVIPGSKIGSERKILEPFIQKNSKYSKYHDIFRQQLPLPILLNAYNTNKDVHIFLYDPAFELNAFDDLDIRAVLINIDEPMLYDYICIYNSYITDIFQEIKLSMFDYIEKKLLLNLYIIPYSYNQNELNNLKYSLQSEYYIYLKNPHQPLTKDSFITNSSIKKELINWHSEEMNGGNIPKHYTAKLSKKNKQKQIKSIQKSSKEYKKGNYLLHTKLKGFKSKKSPWVKKFEKKYGKVKNYNEISKVTGIPQEALKEIVKKGKGAYYSSGSRPNQTPDSWGKARMYSYIMGGPTRKIDQHITKKFKVQFKK